MAHPRNIRHNDVEYDLTHLKITDITLCFGDTSAIQATVEFSNHCYTDSKVNDTFVTNDHGYDRYFCEIRYALSLKVIDWIKSWDVHYCYQRKDERGHESQIVVESDSWYKIKVAFSVRKHKHKDNAVWITVKSVHRYENTRPPTKADRPYKPFSIVIKSVLGGSKAADRTNRQ